MKRMIIWFLVIFFLLLVVFFLSFSWGKDEEEAGTLVYEKEWDFYG